MSGGMKLKLKFFYGAQNKIRLQSLHNPNDRNGNHRALVFAHRVQNLAKKEQLLESYM